MDFKELMEYVDRMRQKGLQDDDILNIFYEAFCRDELSFEDLDKIVKALGYELSKDFIKEYKKQKNK